MRVHRAPPRTPTTRTVCSATRAYNATRRPHATVTRRAFKIMRVRHSRRHAPTQQRGRKAMQRGRNRHPVHNAARLLPRHEPATSPRRNNMRLGSLAARSQVANRAASVNALPLEKRQPTKGALVQNTRAPFLLFVVAPESDLILNLKPWKFVR